MPQASSGSASRRFVWLAFFIVLAIGAYTAAWFYAAGVVVERTGAVLADLSRGGNRAVCENPQARGYPFRIGLFCTATFFEDRGSGVSVASRGLRSAAQVYAPSRLIAELDGPGRLTLPGADPIDVTWETMRASARLARPLPERLSVEGRALSAYADQLGEAGVPLFTAERMEFHLRPNGVDLETALRFEGLRPGAGAWQGSALPAIAGLADLSVLEGVALLGEGRLEPRGLNLEIRNVDLTAETGARLSVSGPFSIDRAGLIDAELTLSAENPAALVDILVVLLPELAQQIQGALPAISALGDRPSLPLRIVKGEARIAFVTLGTIPPL